MQCLSRPEEVKLSLEVYKLSLEIALLELQIDKRKDASLEASEREKNVPAFFNPI